MKAHKSFFDAACVDVTPFSFVLEIEDKKSGNKIPLTYVPTSRIIILANRPKQAVVRYKDDLPYREVFGGAVIAVDTKGFGEKLCRSFSVILDNKNQPIPVDRLDSRDIADGITTTKRKSISMALGIGLGVHLKSGRNSVFTNGVDFVNEVGVTPETDLSIVEPRVGMAERRPYLEWPSALAAARITDPNFHWQVVEFDTSNENGEASVQPYLRVPGGYLVTVKVAYKGIEHEETLAITESKEITSKANKKVILHNQPCLNPTAAMWNTAVMRCLAKAIAHCTGYGLSIYAKASMDELAAMQQIDKEVPKETPKETPAPEASGASSEAHSPGDKDARDRLIEEISGLIDRTKTDPANVLAYHGTSSFEAADPSILIRIHEQLTVKARRIASQKQAA
ncbi:MAG: hypothetical protein DDT34_01882 [Firmicutes bacterium]|nr:hypothetical protein [Bacillota bacterium]